MEKEIININGNDHLVKIYTERRNSTRVSITKSGINIRVPKNLVMFGRERAISQMKNWAIKKIIEMPQLVQKEELKKYVSGDTLIVLGIIYTIEITEKDALRSSGRIKNDTILLRVSSKRSGDARHKDVSSLLSKVLAKKYHQYVSSRVYHHNNLHFRKDINNIFLKNHKSKWGSCSSTGNINLSTRLFFAPSDVLDYVIIHELAHLVEHNHSRNFWNLVEQAMPDYKDKKKWLNGHGHRCRF